MGYVGLGATLVFALPAVLLGIEFLLRGRTRWGVALVVVGVLMVVVEERITTPGDVPSVVAERTVGRVLGDPAADTDDDGEYRPATPTGRGVRRRLGPAVDWRRRRSLRAARLLAAGVVLAGVEYAPAERVAVVVAQFRDGTERAGAGQSGSGDPWTGRVTLPLVGGDGVLDVREDVLD
jgi:hypothetical protein